MTKAYLLGILHDATERRLTYRIATKSLKFAEILKKGIRENGGTAWIYKEGKTRNLWITEFSKKLLNGSSIKSLQDKTEYICGYFDAEGGIAKSSKVRYYIYFCQKNRVELENLKQYLKQLRILSGIVHNPSKKVDPNYWRFFIKAKSYSDFAQKIGSDHPDKRQYLRMKI